MRLAIIATILLLSGCGTTSKYDWDKEDDYFVNNCLVYKCIGGTVSCRIESKGGYHTSKNWRCLQKVPQVRRKPLLDLDNL